jgi:hypothetical protein
MQLMIAKLVIAKLRLQRAGLFVWLFYVCFCNIYLDACVKISTVDFQVTDYFFMAGLDPYRCFSDLYLECVKDSQKIQN